LIETSAGKLEGTVDDGIHAFRGIPFAKAPVGPLRFRRTEPPDPWTGVRDATAFGPTAAQQPSPMEEMFGPEAKSSSEDCLYLNVWTPGIDTGRRPVMVWIHGGAFVSGSGSTPWYSGQSFARKHDVVVVTLNYRLRAPGFPHPAEGAG